MLQSIAICAVVALSFLPDRWPHAAQTALTVVGLGLAACGGVLFAGGIGSLGSALTALPRPRGGALKTDGAYRVVRHPIYGGLLLVALGWSLARAPIVLAPTAALAAIFTLKSVREEAWLAETYPAYAAYRARTPRRFVPWLV